MVTPRTTTAMSLKTVEVAGLRPNPFRRLDEYPIDRAKVEALKESIQSTGFWGTIVARPQGPDYEIAFGHHRMVAIKELGLERVEIIVRDLTNEQMLQMMGRENLEEWGSSAWIELETVRSAIEAYGRGEIELPPVPKKTREDRIRHVSKPPLKHHPYTKATVAKFLGWTNRTTGGTVQPNFACEIAFRALDLIEKGLLEEKALKGLTRSQVDFLVSGQMQIHRAEMKTAKDYHEQAKREQEAAATAETDDERAIRLERAKEHEKSAASHEHDAKARAKGFAKTAQDAYQRGEGVRDVAQRARNEATPNVTKPEIHEVSEFVDRIKRRLFKFRIGKTLVGDIDFLRKKLKADLSRDDAASLCQECKAVIAFMEEICREFAPDNFTRPSHIHEAGETNGKRAIGFERP